MALRRLARDLKALEESPLPGIAAAPLPNDLHTWHFNLRGAGGEHRGLALHGVLRAPLTYPSQPPEVRLCTPVPHPNVWPEDEGFAVCMDMLDVRAKTPYSGWSSSYCVGSVLLQLQSVLFDERAAVFDEVDLPSALRLAAAYSCPCGHRPGCAKPAFHGEAALRHVASRVVLRPALGPLVSGSRAREAEVVALPAAASGPRRAAASGDPLGSAEAPSPCGDEGAKEGAGQGEDDGTAWSEVRSRRTLRARPPPSATPALAAQPCSQGCLCPQGWGIRGRRAPEELSGAQLRNARRAKRRAAQRGWQCGADEASTAASTEDLAHLDGEDRSEASAVEASAVASPIGRVSHRLLIEVLALLPPEDAARLSLCGRFFASLGDDGILWKHLFSQRYPTSALTAESMNAWKHCFLLEVNHIEADLVCFHTKASFRDTVLGVPLDFSVNPRTRRVDYISTTLDLVSADAFDSGLRLSQWNEAFKEWLPLHLTHEHFQRARPRFEKAVVRLSPHWGTSRFHPFMALEVVPKLMNTMIVLLCDRGVEASDRALDGYFLLWRLLRAAVDAYALRGEVDSRLKAFCEPRNRVKAKVPSLGDFLPLLSARDSPMLAWQALAQPVLEESFDRNVLWVCRDHPEFAQPSRNVPGAGRDAERLQATLESSRVSKRLLMFHVAFLELVAGQTADLFFGLPAQHVRQAFKRAVRAVLAVERWPDFFAACRRHCPSPERLTDILRQATVNSLRKGYHSKDTDFSRIQASGVSHILKKGESYQVAAGVRQVRLELGSDSSNILCGACLAYEDLSCAAIVSYDNCSSYHGALRHSGDTMVDGKSKHIIEVDLAALPPAVTRLFFTLCACGCTDLSGFKSPSIDMQDAQSGAPLCTYSIDKAGRAPTVVMAAIARIAGAWRVTALGEHSRVRCCGNYSQVKRDIAKIRF